MTYMTGLPHFPMVVGWRHLHSFATMFSSFICLIKSYRLLIDLLVISYFCAIVSVMYYDTQDRQNVECLAERFLLPIQRFICLVCIVCRLF